MKVNIKPDIIAYPDSHELEFISNGTSEVVMIEPLVMDLLIYMVNKKDEVCTTEELIETLWDGNEFVGKSALRKMVYKLRQVFNAYDKSDLITTIPKKGYRFNGDKTTSESNYPKTTKKRRYKALYIIILLIVLLLVAKLIFPELYHSIKHRLVH